MWVPKLLLKKIPVSDEIKQGCLETFKEVKGKNGKLLFAKSIAPVVMLFVLPFISKKADKLPKWLEWFDNDVSINGDKPEYWDPSYVGSTYYSKGHPRSFRARYAWLGIRNRASRLAQILGHTWKDPKAPSKVYGTAGLVEDTEGWNINEKEGKYQFIHMKRFGPFAWEVNWGYKIWAKVDGRPVANVVCISYSLKRWKGK